MAFLVGTDEAGYGAWAGPLCVAGVRTPFNWVPPLGLTDSKKLSESQREALFLALSRDTTIVTRVLLIDPQTIDKKGVFSCLRQAHETIHQELGDEQTRQIADGTLQLSGRIESIPKADALFPAVSAASILAKVTRDREMVRLASQFPGYDFERHKGYGVAAHETALRKLGPCQMHRMSYGPLSAFKKKPADNLFDVLDALEQE